MTIAVQDFRERMEDKQSVFKTEVLGVKQMGWKADQPRPHILPEESWSLNLWDEIAYPAVQHFAQEQIAWHSKKNDMLSSQVMSVNLFFPLRDHLDVLKPWLSRHYDGVVKVTGIEFEYVGPDNYFNERGWRGHNRTSADVLITWENKDDRKDVLLVNFKFTEPSFGECSQQTNPDKRRCLSASRVIASPRNQCHKSEIGRAYWSMILATDSPFHRRELTLGHYCPFRYDFYELMRYQLLSHALEKDFDAGIETAEVAVMYHAEADRLLDMDHPFAGDHSPLKAWPRLLKTPSTFRAFTIQDFLKTIDAELPSDLAEWRAYLKQRYGV